MAQQTHRIPANLPLPARNLNNVLKILFRLNPAQAEGLLKQGYVALNGRVRRQGWASCEVGDLVTVEVIPQAIVAPIKQTKKKQSTRSIEFLYDDDDIAIVNKPANLLTVPTKHREPHTLLGLVEKRLQQKNPDARAYCVHRLDRGVSGVLVVAKSLEMAERLRDQFAERKPNRKYIAIVAGVPNPSEARLESFLATDDDLNRIEVEDSSQGELAITNYKTQSVWQDAALLDVRLETGRRNQIRVQLAEIGHPILGDPRYRPRQATHWAWTVNRIALHAESIGIRHPRSDEPLFISTPWPQEFRDFVRAQRRT
jgi:23S rRNA pseudouridine1911/1915/1917 synthase